MNFIWKVKELKIEKRKILKTIFEQATSIKKVWTLYEEACQVTHKFAKANDNNEVKYDHLNSEKPENEIDVKGRDVKKRENYWL